MNPHEELLSAYLDGELSPDEKATAEALLATNLEARRFYDSLVALRAAIKALPRREVSPELVRRVVERTEQELAKGKSGAAEQSGDSRVELPPPTDVEPAPWRPLRTWRAVFWPVAALAAAILVMVFQENPPGNELAKHVPAAADHGVDRKAPADGWLDRDKADGEVPINGELWSKDHDHDSKLGGSAPTTEWFGDSKSNLGKTVDSSATLGEATNDFTQLTPSDMVANLELVKEQLENGNTPPGLIVINCAVTPQAAKEATLEKVLADNKISVDSADRGFGADGDDRRGGQGKAGAPKQYNYTRSAKLPEPVGQEVDAYYVEVPYEQLQATVAEFNRRSDEIQAVEVENNPSTPPALVLMNRGGAVDLGGEGQAVAGFGVSLGRPEALGVTGERSEVGATAAPASTPQLFDAESKSDSVPAPKSPAKAEGEGRQDRAKAYAKKGAAPADEASKEESNSPAADKPVATGQLQQAPSSGRQTALSPQEVEKLQQKESVASKESGGRRHEEIENPSRAARFKYNVVPQLTRGRGQSTDALFTDPTSDALPHPARKGESAGGELGRGSGSATQRFDKSGANADFNLSRDGANPAQAPPAAQEAAGVQAPADGRKVASSPPLRVLIRQFVVSADRANEADAAKNKAANQAPSQEVVPAEPAAPSPPTKALNDPPRPQPTK